MTTISVIYGKEQVEKVLNNITLEEAEATMYQNEYSFETQKEADAFAKGIREAVGWQEVYVSEEVLSEG